MDSGATMRLSKRDRRRAMGMLGRISSEEAQEIQIMLMLNVKAELQVLEEEGLSQILTSVLGRMG